MKKPPSLETIKPGEILLLETSPEQTGQAGTSAAQILVKKGYQCVVVSALRPCTELVRTYIAHKIDLSELIIIDFLCKRPKEELPNVIHIEEITQLTNLALALDECFSRMSGKKALIIESINTMLIHNPSDVFARFIHSTLTKLRIKSISGILIETEGLEKNIHAEIAQLCDANIHLSRTAGGS